jgi:hypothetical protein
LLRRFRIVLRAVRSSIVASFFTDIRTFFVQTAFSQHSEIRLLLRDQLVYLDNLDPKYRRYTSVQRYPFKSGVEGEKSPRSSLPFVPCSGYLLAYGCYVFYKPSIVIGLHPS